jgi:predicted RNA-binding Zn-ribbon protein involved in translation (DUF1610 family)
MAKDRFTISLKCPKCGRAGEANWEQEDGWAFVKGNTATTVKSVTAGFSRVKKESFWGDDVNFVCDACGELSADDPRK